MEIKLRPQIPSARGKVIEEYKQTFAMNEYYEAYTLGDNLEIKKGLGCIQSNREWNYHNNYDDSEDELYFKANKMSSSSLRIWWSPSKEKVRALQLENIKAFKEVLMDNIDYLNDLKDDYEKDTA